MDLQKILDEEFCTKLVQSASTIIGHNILITNDKGIVLASNNTSRIGSLHEASLEAISVGQNVYHDSSAAARLAGTQPGMTIPLVLDGKAIGTIGITGLPEEISRYAMLLLQMSQLFMSFQMRQQTYAQIDYRKQNLLREIAIFDSHTRDPEGIYNSAYELGVDLRAPRRAILMKIISNKSSTHTNQTPRFPHGQIVEQIQQIFRCPRDFTCMQADTEFVILASLSEFGGDDTREGILQKCQQLQESLAAEHLKVCIGIGSPANSVQSLRVSYEDAQFSVRVLTLQPNKADCLFIDDIILEKLVIQLPSNICSEILEMYFQAIFNDKRSDEVAQLIACWCRSRFNFSQTAKALHVHKSTLVYRFQRIQSQFGLDLYDFDKVMVLYLLYLRYTLF